MATDPSWLYSTIAQSSAAIVAIIGGFITATILKLSAEKESLIKLLAEKRRRVVSMKEHRVDITISNFKDLEDAIPILENRIKEFSYPPNLGWGIGVLGYLAILNIFFPVIIIANEIFYPWAKNLVMYSFFGGILLVFAYIVFQIAILRRK